jgi:hypothetical protein
MNKQDRQGVRNAQDLEQKYKLGSIKTVEKSASQQRENLSRVEQAIAQFVATMTGNFNTLQGKVSKNESDIANTKKQLDGKANNSGWEKNKLLGTDEEGKVVEKDINFGVLNFYPIGSVYTTLSTDNPSAVFGGEWVLIAEGHLLVGLDSEDEIPKLFQGEDKCFIWKRTA